MTAENRKKTSYEKKIAYNREHSRKVRSDPEGRAKYNASQREIMNKKLASDPEYREKKRLYLIEYRKRKKLERKSPNSVRDTVEPERIQYCKHCGNVIYYKGFKNCKVEDSSGDELR